VCEKPKISLNSVLKEMNRSKNLTSIQTVFWQKPSAVRKKWQKITLLAFSVQIKNVLKHDRNWV